MAKCTFLLFVFFVVCVYADVQTMHSNKDAHIFISGTNCSPKKCALRNSNYGKENSLVLSSRGDVTAVVVGFSLEGLSLYLFYLFLFDCFFFWVSVISLRLFFCLFQLPNFLFYAAIIFVAPPFSFFWNNLFFFWKCSFLVHLPFVFLSLFLFLLVD